MLLVGNHLIDFDGDDEAHGLVYCRGSIEPVDDPPTGRYLEQAILYRDHATSAPTARRFLARVHEPGMASRPPNGRWTSRRPNWPANHHGLGTVPYNEPTWQAFWQQSERRAGMTAIGLFVDLRRLPDSARSAAEHTAWTIELLAQRASRSGAMRRGSPSTTAFPDGYPPQPLVLAAARRGTHVADAARGPASPSDRVAPSPAPGRGGRTGRRDLGRPGRDRHRAGYSPQEFEWFGADLTKRFTTTDAAAIEVRRLLASGEVTPAPVQPEVPIWLGYQGPKAPAAAERRRRAVGASTRHCSSHIERD